MEGMADLTTRSPLNLEDYCRSDEVIRMPCMGLEKRVKSLRT